MSAHYVEDMDRFIDELFDENAKLHGVNAELLRKHENQKATIMRYIEQVNQLESRLVRVRDIDNELLTTLRFATEVFEDAIPVGNPTIEIMKAVIAKAEGKRSSLDS